MWWTVFCFFAVTECRVHDADSLQVCSQATIHFRCARRLQSSVLNLNIMVCSCQTVDWVCRGVVVSSGPSPLAYLTVSEQGFGFLVSWGGQLFTPRLGLCFSWKEFSMS